MGIWIRSQDRSMLIEAAAVWICDEYLMGENLAYKNKDEDYGVYLGKYDSKDEAAAVLDKIQRLIGEIEYGRCTDNCINPIFEMPAAGFMDASSPEYLCPHCGQNPGSGAYCKYCGTKNEPYTP